MVNLVVWGLVAGLYSPIIYQLYTQRWETIDYTHAYFILPISIVLAVRNLRLLRSARNDETGARNDKASAGQGRNSGLFLTLLGLFMFLFGWRWGYLFISTLSMIPLLFGVIFYLYGARMAKAMSFPILYLLLMAPPPLGVLDAITLPMRHGVSAAAAGALKLFHYPIQREGLMLYLGGHEIFMGAPCSGFRSLITMFSLGVVYVYVISGTMWKKLILVAAIVPLALFGNLVRVVTLCLLTYYKGEEVAQGFLHYFSGGVIFVIMIIGLLVIEFFLERAEKKA